MLKIKLIDTVNIEIKYIKDKKEKNKSKEIKKTIVHISKKK